MVEEQSTSAGRPLPALPSVPTYFLLTSTFLLLTSDSTHYLLTSVPTFSLLTHYSIEVIRTAMVIKLITSMLA